MNIVIVTASLVAMSFLGSAASSLRDIDYVFKRQIK